MRTSTAESSTSISTTEEESEEKYFICPMTCHCVLQFYSACHCQMGNVILSELPVVQPLLGMVAFALNLAKPST